MMAKSFYRERIIIVVLLGLCSYLSVSTCIHKQAANNILETVVEKKTDTIKGKTDTITFLKMVAVNENYYQYKKESSLRDSVKTLKYLLTVADSKVPPEPIIKEVIVNNSNGVALQKQIDSLRNVSYVYKDKFLKLLVTHSDTLPPDSLYFDYDVQLAVKNYYTHWYSLRGHTDITSLDPRVTIMGKKTYTVPQPNPSHGLRIRGLARYNWATKTFTIGSGLEYDFGKNGQYSLLNALYYNATTGRFEPVTNVRFDLKTF